MANFTWTNPAGGDWSTESNWNPAGIPGNGANIMLPTLAGAYTSVDNLAFIDDIRPCGQTGPSAHAVGTAWAPSHPGGPGGDELIG